MLSGLRRVPVPVARDAISATRSTSATGSQLPSDCGLLRTIRPNNPTADRYGAIRSAAARCGECQPVRQVDRLALPVGGLPRAVVARSPGAVSRFCSPRRSSSRRLRRRSGQENLDPVAATNLLKRPGKAAYRRGYGIFRLTSHDSGGVDGGPRDPGASKRHNRLARLLANAVDATTGPDWNADTDVDVRLQDVPLNNRRPDVTVYLAETIDVTPTRPEHVLLVVEVVSPGSETTDRIVKASQYARAGIQFYWRVEQPATGVSLVYTYVLDAATGRYREGEVFTGVVKLTAPFSFEVDLGQI